MSGGGEPGASGSEEGGDVICRCGNPAVLRVCKKEGVNQGREFYSCSKTDAEGSCGFFSPADGKPWFTRKAAPGPVYPKAFSKRIQVSVGADDGVPIPRKKKNLEPSGLAAEAKNFAGTARSLASKMVTDPDSLLEKTIAILAKTTETEQRMEGLAGKFEKLLEAVGKYICACAERNSPVTPELQTLCQSVAEVDSIPKTIPPPPPIPPPNPPGFIPVTQGQPFLSHLYAKPVTKGEKVKIPPPAEGSPEITLFGHAI